MFNFMVTSEGGLTTAGYAIAIIAGICFVPGCDLLCRKAL